MLSSISPIDGRYRKTTEPLAEFFSESALMKYRLVVEGEYLIALSEAKIIRKLSEKEKSLIRSLYDLPEKDAQIISDIETKGYKNIKATDHDVKAVEYFIKEKLGDSSLKDILEYTHFALTSYDTNTPARAMMLSDALEQTLIPAISSIVATIGLLSKKYAKLPMLSRTHGQSASPTTFGKEFNVFHQRLQIQLSELKTKKLSVKFSGATGNFSAHMAAHPKINWIKFSKDFIKILSRKRLIALEPNLIATQIDPHDSEAAIFDNLRRINTILIGLNQDVWRYISDDWIIQKPAEGTIGSSTMPHKINPIKFENSEGNLGMANALFEFFSRKLPISRLQRDLSDSTVERNFGSAFGYCLIAYTYLLKGLSRITINEPKVKEALNSHPEVVAEAIQTILRREGVKMPYEQLKELTRGKQISLADIHSFIDGLDVSPKVKMELKAFTPENYIGLASKLANL
ncbi:MAG: adenylosuccinate lyase [Candidatus Doudnabacteria bacterium]|nr:adenylosuccinate lyase [Candidatus Doudnabacteria bacterium]